MGARERKSKGRQRKQKSAQAHKKPLFPFGLSSRPLPHPALLPWLPRWCNRRQRGGNVRGHVRHGRRGFIVGEPWHRRRTFGSSFPTTATVTATGVQSPPQDGAVDNNGSAQEKREGKTQVREASGESAKRGQDGERRTTRRKEWREGEGLPPQGARTLSTTEAERAERARSFFRIPDSCLQPLGANVALAPFHSLTHSLPLVLSFTYGPAACRRTRHGF